jgi:hypothetical protein
MTPQFSKDKIETHQRLLALYLETGAELAFCIERTKGKKNARVRVYIAPERHVLDITNTVAIACGFNLKESGGQWHIATTEYSSAAAVNIANAMRPFHGGKTPPYTTL